jgi:acyl-CoA synthetase (AMP-forming)/AMP-acid ligase II
MPSTPNDSGDGNFANLLWQAAERWPERVAIVEDDQSRSFADLGRLAASAAHAIAQGGVVPGDVVAILARRGAASAAAFFGSLATGAVTCMVNEAYRPRQVRHVLERTGARILVVSTEFWTELEGQLPEGITRIDPDDLAPSGTFTPVPRAADDPAQLIFTSGSTGQPKAVLSSHANLWAGAQIVPAYLGIEASDRIGSLLPFSFVYGFSQLACGLATGASVVIERATLPNDIVEGLRRGGVTVLAGVPPLWAQLLPVLERAPLEDLRIATCAGGRLAPEMVKRLRTCQPHTNLFLMYGLTEVFRSTYLPPDEVDAHPDSMGRAIPHSEVVVVNDEGRPCAPGEIGELVHAGPTVSLGYWRDPEATAAVFRPHPLRPESGERAVFSGDLVRQDEQGLLYYVGRRDRMIKTLGFRVSPDEVADALLASGLVREAAVTSEPDEARGQRIVAHVVLKDGAAVLGVKQFCGVELPRYMQPARYQVHEMLPRNATGKIDLQALDSMRK